MNKNKISFLQCFLITTLAPLTTWATLPLELFSADPDITRNTSQLIESRGFIPEIHYPITEDGYILTLIRILNPFVEPSQRRKLRPIYLQHGLFGNSDGFLITQYERLTNNGYFNMKTLSFTNCSGLDSSAVGRNLAYVLSACGYDVWIGNYRGTRYSNRHIRLDPHRDPEYWAFSIDQLALYDVTANIQHILSTTGFTELAYAGHSLGTTVMFQLLSYKPEFSRFIKPFISLAPVAHISHIRAPVFVLGAYTPPLIKYLASTNKPFFGVTADVLTKINHLIGTFVCGNSLLIPFCELFIFVFCGFDYPNLESKMVPFIYGHFPDDTSARVLAHHAQRVVEDTFSFYDYGSETNKFKYGSQHPPPYNLSSIISPYIVMVSGINDWLADPEDVDYIRSQLTVPIYRDYVIPYKLFNHADHVTGTNAGQYQNAFVLKILSEIYRL